MMINHSTMIKYWCINLGGHLYRKWVKQSIKLVQLWWNKIIDRKMKDYMNKRTIVLEVMVGRLTKMLKIYQISSFVGDPSSFHEKGHFDAQISKFLINDSR